MINRVRRIAGDGPPGELILLAGVLIAAISGFSCFIYYYRLYSDSWIRTPIERAQAMKSYSESLINSLEGSRR